MTIKNHIYISILLCAVLMALLTPHASAQTSLDVGDRNEAPLVAVSILPERNHVSAGDEIWIAIKQDIKDGWHTYWRNPGDSGSAPQINWALPAGFEVSDIYWPIPAKLPYGPLLNYGYSGSTALLQKLTIPQGYQGGDISLKGDIDILVCEVECVPILETVELTLKDTTTIDTANQRDNLNEIETYLNTIPQKIALNAHYYEENGNLTLKINTKDLKSAENIQFFPHKWGIVENTAPINAEIDDKTLILTQKRDKTPLNTQEPVTGVLKYNNNDIIKGVEISAQFKNTAPSALMGQSSGVQSIENSSVSNDVASTTVAPPPKAQGFFSIIAFALIGGLILNLMPCVFPVLSLKVLTLVKMSEKSKSRARAHGIAYTSGIILSMLAIAGTLLALKAAGSEIGWGFQLQNPVIVTALIYLMFLIAMNLFGIFDVGNFISQKSAQLDMKANNALAQTKEKSAVADISGSFFTGVLATLVATPCTAPFMAGAIGYALTANTVFALLVFAALGLGLASPYLLLSFAPALSKYLPRPGAWMVTFKQLLAFPILVFTVWLYSVLIVQVGNNGAILALIGLLIISFGVWIKTLNTTKKLWSLTAKALILLCFVATIYSMYSMRMFGTPDTQSVVSSSSMVDDTFGEAFSPATLKDAITNTNDPIFVEMTAAWCITCKVNHKIALGIDSTRTLFKAENVRYLVGDWTNQDADITQYLQEFGRNGVPLYVFYGRPGENGIRPAPQVLPQVLSPSLVKKYVTP